MLVFGESINDAQSIATLIEYLQPVLAGRVRARAKPVSLTRDAGKTAVRSWAADLTKAAKATVAGGQPVAAVVVHRDADGHDPSGEVEDQLRKQLRGVANEVAVPVQATEAWWLHFPDAVEAARPIAWRGVLSRNPGNVDAQDRPKTELQRRTRETGSEYAEADSPRIAQLIASQNIPPRGTSASWSRFTAAASRL